MSERASFRRFAPVEENVEAPARYSQTLLKHADGCPRAAYLYLRFQGGAQAVELVRGTVAHEFAERLMLTLIEQGEASLYAPQEGEDPVAAAREVAAVTKAWVDEIVDELGAPLPEADVDDVREIAYHLAVGLDVDPETVVAVERKFVLEVDVDDVAVPVSGKVDLAALHPDGFLDVVDYKTSFYVPPEEDVQRLFQTPLYGALILFGLPVEIRPCERCGGSGVVGGGPVDDFTATVDAAAAFERHAGERPLPSVCTGCGGAPRSIGRPLERRGRGYVEIVGEPVADGVQWVRARQMYPRFLRPDGTIPSRGGDRLLGRADLLEFLEAVRRAVRRVRRGVETGDWPAITGPHCTECPARALCPIPAELNRHAGRVNTAEQASEAFEWALRAGDEVSATRREVVAWVKANAEALGGALRVGEATYELVTSHSTAVRRRGQRSDWDGLRDAIVEAVEFGAPFDVNDWLRVQTKTEFKIKKESE